MPNHYAMSISAIKGRTFLLGTSFAAPVQPGKLRQRRGYFKEE